MMQEKELERSPLRHVLSGLVGCDPQQLRPEVTQFRLAVHDKLLLCTDGLTSHVSDADVASLLSIEASAEEACQLLI